MAMIEEKEDEEVEIAARKLGRQAIKKLGQWMKSENPKASVAACNALLDRGFGKPNQRIKAAISGSINVTIKRSTDD